MTKESNASLHVLAVRPIMIATRGGVVPVLDVEEAAGPEHIAGRAARQAEEAGVAATVHVVGGEPVETIVATADHVHADLIVVGSRGLGAIRGALMGSVSHELIKQARIPVTVVHTRD